MSADRFVPWIFLPLLLIAAACSSPARKDCLSLPAADQVSKVIAYQRNTYDSATGRHMGEKVITEKCDLTELIDLLAIHNDSMEPSWHTFPTPGYTIEIRAADSTGVNVPMFIWLGRNWIGGKDEGGGNVSRSIDGNYRGKLLNALGFE